LSEPNAIAQTAGSPVAESLKIRQPLAVKEADVQDMSSKSQQAVSVDNAGVTLVSAFPFAVYADPDVFVISFEVEYAVVDLFRVAELVYNAMLKVFPDDAVKLCIPCKTSVLKLLHIADVIAIIFFS
tara:strand:+ start:228 stop:608 length:381 start_codon:yes stop_codon:yes gene_type:complete